MPAQGHKKPVLIIGGPTASGKTGLGITCAEHYDGVVINADSMQVYDALHILTAHPDKRERAAAPHRLYGALSPAEKCSAAMWRDMALSEIDAAQGAGKLPILVGGTGFYLKTLIEGISPIPDVPDDVRATAIRIQQEMGNPAFYAALADRDPEMAARLDPNNTQRLIRAWEILETTGRSLSYWQDLPPDDLSSHLRFFVVSLLPPRAELYARCDARFLHMLENGAREEVAGFVQKIQAGEVPENAAVTQALGYREIAAMLSGTMAEEQAVEKAQQKTRQYAKKQMTWQRHQMKADLVIDDFEQPEWRKRITGLFDA